MNSQGRIGCVWSKKKIPLDYWTQKGCEKSEGEKENPIGWERTFQGKNTFAMGGRRTCPIKPIVNLKEKIGEVVREQACDCKLPQGGGWYKPEENEGMEKKRGKKNKKSDWEGRKGER